MTDSPRVGVVGLPGSWSSEALADAIARRSGFRRIVDMGRVECDLASGRVLDGDLDLCSLDALVVKKIGESYSPRMLDRLEVLGFVADAGVPVFSRPRSITGLLDRLSCTCTLRRAGIPMPETVVTEDEEAAARAIRRFGEAVLKPLYSTKARGIRVASAEQDPLEQVRAFRKEGNPVIYVQRKVSLPGRDYGVCFLGGEHIGTYARVASEEAWNTTIREGGRYAPHEPSPEMLALAHRAQAPFDLDFTSVDVAESEEGLLVFEVSAFGGFRGLREGLGVDAADRYADYVLARVGRGGGKRS